MFNLWPRNFTSRNLSYKKKKPTQQTAQEIYFKYLNIFKKLCMEYILYKFELLCCIPETNIILQANYSSIFRKEKEKSTQLCKGYL